MLTEFVYPTRAWVHINNGEYDSNIRIGPNGDANHLLTNRSFRWRASKQWNLLPIELKQSESLNEFKHYLKLWILTNIQLKATKNQ